MSLAVKTTLIKLFISGWCLYSKSCLLDKFLLSPGTNVDQAKKLLQESRLPIQSASDLSNAAENIKLYLQSVISIVNWF